MARSEAGTVRPSMRVVPVLMTSLVLVSGLGCGVDGVIGYGEAGRFAHHIGDAAVPALDRQVTTVTRLSIPEIIL